VTQLTSGSKPIARRGRSEVHKQTAIRVSDTGSLVEGEDAVVCPAHGDAHRARIAECRVAHVALGSGGFVGRGRVGAVTETEEAAGRHGAARRRGRALHACPFVRADHTMLRATATCLLLVASLGGCRSKEPVTVVPPAASSEDVLWAVGDGTASEEAAELVEMMEAAEPRHVLYLGDVYEDGTAGDFRENFHATYGKLARRTWPTPGNHEWKNARKGYFPYWKKARGRPLAPYYSFQVGRWRILSLNSEMRGRARSRQVRWLRGQLEEPTTCRIAFWHRPRFSAGEQGDQEDVEPLWRAVAGRAAIVLAGHDHDSQRFRPLEGTTSFVAGAGGRELYEVDEDDPRLAFGDDKHFAALRIVLNGRTAELAFVSNEGRVLDESRVRCR